MGGDAAHAIGQLVHGYARAVDRRDRAALLDLFTTDAELEFEHATAGTSGAYAGRDAIGGIVDRIGRFDRTFHHGGGHVVAVDGRVATGESHCLAHHVRFDDDGGIDQVLFIRYLDHYVLGDDDGRWRISRRRVEVDWMETRQLGPQAW